jgi:ABC-type nitrate/sulfonate/bicarbonate transport system substrate-binding protein
MERFTRMRRTDFCRRAGTALVAGVAGIPVSVVAQTPLQPLRIVTAPTEIPISMINAHDLGYFKDAGIDAQIISLSNGPAGIAAVLSGSADIGFASSLSVVVAYDKGLPVTVVSGTDLHRATNPVQGIFMASASSPLHTGKDFNGKTVSVPGLGGTQNYAVRAWVDATGGDSSTLRFVEIPNSSVPAAITAGRIDAGTTDALTLHSTESRALREVTNVYNAIAPKFMTGVWYATAPWVEQHRELTRTFIKVFQRYSAWANSHPADEVRFYSKQSGLSIDDLQATPRALFEPTLTLEALQPIIDVAYRYGAIKRRFPANELLSRSVKNN